jgi:hypothetical protein
LPPKMCGGGIRTTITFPTFVHSFCPIFL